MKAWVHDDIAWKIGRKKARITTVIKELKMISADTMNPRLKQLVCEALQRMELYNKLKDNETI